jgi:hypothetical protein
MKRLLIFTVLFPPIALATGRDDEFWLLAEQQLRNENKSSPSRTPDNL